MAQGGQLGALWWPRGVGWRWGRREVQEGWDICVHACMPGHVQLFATPRTVACQGPFSMDFPCKNTGVGCHFLLQGIFLTQGSNPCLLHLLHWYLYHWATWEAPDICIQVADALHCTTETNTTQHSKAILFQLTKKKKKERKEASQEQEEGFNQSQKDT